MFEHFRKLSTVDAAFLNFETPEMPMHVGSISLFKLPNDYQGSFFENFKAMIQGRIQLVPILKCKLSKTPFDIDNPSWIVDDQFDIDRHIFRAAIPAPYDTAKLHQLAGWIHAKTLNRARPLWEFYVFEDLPDNQVALYCKIHHACIDGGAGAAITQIIFDTTPEPRNIAKGKSTTHPPAEARDMMTSFLEATLKIWGEPNEISKLKLVDLPRSGRSDILSVLFDNTMLSIEHSMRVMSDFPSLAMAAAEIGGGLVNPIALKNMASMLAPATAFNKSISSERSYAATSISLPRAKAVSKAAGGKLNDVVLAICSGALRRYLLERNQLPAKSLTACVPISLRSAGDAEANNQVFGMVCPIASNIEDGRQRLETIINETLKSKEFSNPLKPLVPHLSGMAPLGAPLFIQVIALLYSRSNLADFVPAPANVMISNVPGPSMKLYGAGAELLHIYPVSIPAHGMGLNITVQSYKDQMDFGFIAGANVVSNCNEIAKHLLEELEELERAYGLEAAA